MSKSLDLREPRSLFKLAAPWLALAGAAIAGLVLAMLMLSPETPSGPVSPSTVSPEYRRPTVTPTSPPSPKPSPSIRGAFVGSPAPDFTLTDLAGQPHSLLQHRGQAVLLNFWTTWCFACLLEMPALQQAYETYRDQGFVVFGINLTAIDDRDQIRPYVEELGLTFPILLDPDSHVNSDLYRVIAVPTSVFIDREGHIAEIVIGAIPLEGFESRIQALIEE